MIIDNLPLYWRLRSRSAPENIVPDTYAFEFGFNESIQMISQKIGPELEECLEIIYRAEYNIGYLQDGNIIAKGYGTDFKYFMDSVIDKKESNVTSILEVGCGGCTLLEQFKEDGFEVLGVDPSPLALRAGAEKGIDIVSEFFPTPKISKKYDIIFHSDVLEHVSDPVKFLANQKNQLSDDGLIFISIPDCNESIAKGDVSMIIHQHINYFDNESLKNCIEASGLKVVSIQTAKYGGSLYAFAQNSEVSSFEPKVGNDKYQNFLDQCDCCSSKILKYINDSLSAGESLGFYVPLRAIPYISLLGLTERVRFFDDTDHWYDCAFDGVDVYIENFSDLQREPVDTLIICSLTFGETIKNKIQTSSINIKHLKTLDEFLD